MSTSEADEFCLVFTEDYKRHVLLHGVQTATNLALIGEHFHLLLSSSSSSFCGVPVALNSIFYRYLNYSFSERFFDTVIKECPDVSFDKLKLTTQYKFKEEEIQ
jgi:hypothetical protein